MDFVNTLNGKRFVVPLVFLAALVMLATSETAYWRTRGSVENLASMGVSRITILKLTENLINAESVQRGYVLTGDEKLLRNLEGSQKVLDETFATLAIDFAKDPEFIAALGHMRLKVDARLALMAQSVRLKRAGRNEEAIQIVLNEMGTMELVHSLDDELLAMQTQEREDRSATVHRALLMARIGVAGLTALSLLALLMYLRQARVLGVHQHELKLIEQTVRADLEAEVALRTAELTDLTRYLLNAREDERNRLARNLHDDLGALLTSAKLDAARIKARLAKTAPAELELLGHLVVSLNACVALGRNIIENQRPSALSNLGLVATLEILAREFSENTGVPVQCQLSPVALSPNAELMLYRVVQEALTNISKYANATHAWVSLASQAGQINLAVRDNGRGFNTQTKPGTAYGLLGMRFRVEAEGGHLTVTSTPGNGTQILATLKVATVQP